MNRLSIVGGFRIIQYHVVKAEMSVGSPKQGTRQPIDIDFVLVCAPRCEHNQDSLFAVDVRNLALTKVEGLRRGGMTLSLGDFLVIAMGSAMLYLSSLSFDQVNAGWDTVVADLPSIIDTLEHSHVEGVLFSSQITLDLP